MNQSHERPLPRSDWGSILCGALVCLALQILFTALGSAIGLSALNIGRDGTEAQTAGIAAGVYFAVTLLISFFVGGYVASGLAPHISKRSRALQGISVWAGIIVAFTYVFGSNVISTLGTLGTSAGLGLASAGGLQQALQEVSELNPKIVSDIDLSEGKVISRVTIDNPDSASQMAGSVKKSAIKNKNKIEKEIQKPGQKAELKEIARDARSIGARASWIAFSALFLSAISTLFGSWAGARNTQFRQDLYSASR